MDRLLRVFVVSAVSLVCLAAGCSHSKGSRTGVSGPGMTSKREAGLLELASREMHCPEDSLVPAFLESSEKNLHLYRVAGCNVTFNVLLHCIGVCLWVEMPDKRAAQELGCPSEQLQMKYVGGGGYSYSGCGKSGTWVHKANHWEGGPDLAR
jgi:hypothetical protein